MPDPTVSIVLASPASQAAPVVISPHVAAVVPLAPMLRQEKTMTDGTVTSAPSAMTHHIMSSGGGAGSATGAGAVGAPGSAGFS